ncbi:MAG: hypothetical protein PHN51_07205 [Candidatus Nanopelagicales bacterium]|nr:hypothetical protein [Candidatus Nanopelagicales bacterium]
MSVIKTVAVTAMSLGMVAVAGVAGFAVVNSASPTPAPETITLLANETATAGAPMFVPGELPPIVTFEQSVARTPDQTSAQIAATIPSVKISKTSPVAATPTPVTTPSPTQITSLQARTAVLSEVKGTVTSISEVTRNGFEAFAVKVALTDGGTATGYVHKATGVIFDWDAVGAPAAQPAAPAKAPAATVTTTKKDDDDDDDDDESEHKSEDTKRPSSSHDDDDD